VGKVARDQRAMSSAVAGDFAHPTTLIGFKESTR